MSKEIKVSKKIKFNINYLNFIVGVIENKVKIEKNIIKESYEKEVSLRFNNIRRVDGRNKRKELRNILLDLLKERNISLDKFNKVSGEIVSLSKEKKRSNYLEIEV